LAPSIKIQDRIIGLEYKPFVIAEVGINHEGDASKAKKMIKDAADHNAECVKFQCHIIEDEMIKNDVIPGNATESIWDIMKRCSLTEEEEISLKKYAESLGLIYLNTPFSRKAADRLEGMGISAYKIGSGECNNYPLIDYIASFGKPIILSTGMNNLESIKKSIDIFEKHGVEYALLHTTSMYPTPYENVRLGALEDLKKTFPNTVLGLSDHSVGNYTCFAAVSLGASILEKHFTSDKNWPGPDIPVSIDPRELKDLVFGCNAIFQARGGHKTVLAEEQPTIDFAYSTVVAIKDITKGELLSKDNIWVKRPGTGKIKAENFEKLLNQKATSDIKKDTQIDWNMIEIE
jgi:N-acetylneuraminate synthase